MTNTGICLAAMDGFGQVYDCGGCGNIHVQVGPVNLTLEPKAYMQLVAMISTSAANIELWLQQKAAAGESLEWRAGCVPEQPRREAQQDWNGRQGKEAA